MANALVEGQPPAGMPIERRLHARGTLARLRYEQLGADGTVENMYEIRALLPALPYFGRDAPKSEFGEIECPQECREGLQRTQASLIARSGNAGLADEWVLRMPVGRTFDLGRRSIAIQDVAQEQPRALADSPMRVTLLQTCAGRARIGTVTHLEFYPNAIIPIPRELRALRWVQLDGCEAMMGLPSFEVVRNAPAAPRPAPRLRPSWPDPASPWEAIRPARTSGLGYLILNVDEAWLERHGRALVFRMLRACRYDASANRWIALPLPDGDGDISLRQGRVDNPPTRVAFRFPEDIALFWAEWEEIDRDSTRPGRMHRALVPSGSVACQDASLRAPTEEEVIVCVPSGMVSETKLVPVPEEHCAAPSRAAISSPPR